ncbi:MAG: hypothetical protein ACREKL_00265 [Chthoniobacterales bacterium]
MGQDTVRVRCERCRNTWEEKFPSFRCAACGATGEPPPPWPPAEQDVDPRRFKKFSDAVAVGCERYPLPELPAGHRVGGRQKRSALQAAWVAEFGGDRQYVVSILERSYPELETDVGADCPAEEPCPDWKRTNPRTLEVAILHLEDDKHEWGREKVAGWLRSHGF